MLSNDVIRLAKDYLKRQSQSLCNQVMLSNVLERKGYRVKIFGLNPFIVRSCFQTSEVVNRKNPHIKSQSLCNQVMLSNARGNE